MDAAWKVYVGDRRFDDNQISNLFLKLKYETVGRFTFDFRPIDGDESYMVVNNTLRIFWGDLHKLDGVIQRVDWDDSQYCYHVFGADIRGFLLDRVNTEPSTVNSYTSDIQTQVQYTGCDFPSNIWTGAGDKIGTYTFHYKLGIQNTIRITGATQNIWHNVIERGTVYEHQNGCLYDATKNWETNKYKGATLRFISGVCKNNVYNVNGNTANRVCIRLPGEFATDYATQEATADYITIGGKDAGNCAINSSFENATIDPWLPYELFNGTIGLGNTGYAGGAHSLELKTFATSNRSTEAGAYQRIFGFPTLDRLAPGSGVISFYLKTNWTVPMMFVCELQRYGGYYYGPDITSPCTDWTEVTWSFKNTATIARVRLNVDLAAWPQNPSGYATAQYAWIDNVKLYHTSITPATGGGGLAMGKIPGCSRLGDIYEIVTASMSRTEPASLAPATLEKDNHIIKYNQTDELPDHPTVVTVIGTGDTPPANTVSFSVISVGAAITQSDIDAALAQVPRDIWSFHPGPTAEEGVNWQKGSVYFSDPTVGDLPIPLQDFTICISDPNDFEDLGDSYGSTHTGTHRCGVWNIPGIVDGTVLHELLHTTPAIFLHTDAEQLADTGFMRWLATAHPTYGSAEVTANYGTLCNEYALYTYRNG